MECEYAALGRINSNSELEAAVNLYLHNVTVPQLLITIMVALVYVLWFC
jgi:hypothetical protein